MKKSFLILIISLLSLYAMADDTVSLQTLLDGGNVTLLSGHTYNISSPGVIVKGVVNGNNAVINYTGTAGRAVRMSTLGCSLSNVTIQGQWNVLTTAGNPGGESGIVILNDNVSINNVRIKKISGYGILCGGPGNFSGLSITNNNLSEIGYIAFFYSADANGTGNSTFSGNIVDRSTLNPTNARQPAVAIRGSTNNPAYITTGWTISGNTIKMPLRPSFHDAEGLEFRYGTNSTITGNICDKGTIPISVVRCSNTVVRGNTCTNAGEYNIEIASCTYTQTIGNTVTGSYGAGILFDGYSASPASPGSSHCTSSGDIVSGNVGDAIESFTLCSYITVINGNITTNGKGINLQQTDSVTIVNTIIDGQSKANTTGVFIDKGYANVSAKGGNIKNCTRMVFAYDTRTNQVIDNIVFTNVLQAGTMTQISSSFSNGAHFGPNVHFLTKSTITFPAITTKVYGVADFDPGAVSDNAVFYSSSNSTVATIVSGKIHVKASGTSNIQASNGDTAIIRTLTVIKAQLSIFVDSKDKRKGSANPALTFHYLGLVNGDAISVLTTQPILSTTALTNSPVGIYPITASAAVSDKYAFTYYPGILTISFGRQIKARFGGIIRTP